MGVVDQVKVTVIARRPGRADEAIPVHRGGVLRDAGMGAVPMHPDCFVARCARSSQ
jgi:hypothetical protein